jgi:hypothetical protein
MVKPLTELIKKSKEFIWSDICQEAFKKLEQAFISPEIMAYPEDHGDFILDTDACDSSIGAVLSQIQDGCLRVISYGSRILNKAYSTVRSNAERISTHLAILPLGSLRLKSQISTW